MSDGIFTAAAGAVARQNQLDVAANNLANVNTTGFRASKSSFEEVLTEATSPSQHFVVGGESRLSVEAGPLIKTGNPLDLALNGPAFFAARAEGGVPVLLKTVSLQVSADGLLTDSSGRPLLQNGNIVHLDPQRPLTVSAEGELSQDGVIMGRLDVFSVADPGALSYAGAGSFIPNEQSGLPFLAQAEVIGGCIEGSNVNPVGGMVEMITIQRDYQSLLKVVSAYKEADERLIRTTGE